MAAPVPRKALIAITSYNEVFYPDGKKTGLFFTEALHPFEVLTEAGFEVELATETGKFGYDDHSLTPDFATAEDQAVYRNHDHPFMVKLVQQLKNASDLKKSDYWLFFASAGHASLYDYPHARGLQSIAEDVWARGGIVSAVCHGPAILPGILDAATGKSIIAGKAVTGFTTEGEIVLDILEKVKRDQVPTIEEGAAGVGAKYLSPLHPFDDYSVTDGRVVTGANPASARSTAERAVKAFDSL